MQIEIVIIAVIVIGLMNLNGYISLSQLISDNELLFRKLKEDDYDFLVKARYGDGVNANALFNKRIKYGFLAIVGLSLFMINKMNGVTFLVICVVGFAIFKLSYLQLKNYYKVHVAQIDTMLPYYLKSLEILIQHYTVPVAIGRSMSDAPEIFKEGLQEMIDAINSGDDTITPYMEFAKKYPVRDSMRMMRLLYRLSLGKQENKQEQLLTFSRTISNLQQKARETKYRNRLEKMEKKTMSMLIATGMGLMVLLVLAVLQMMNI